MRRYCCSRGYDRSCFFCTLLVSSGSLVSHSVPLLVSSLHSSLYKLRLFLFVYFIYVDFSKSTQGQKHLSYLLVFQTLNEVEVWAFCRPFRKLNVSLPKPVFCLKTPTVSKFQLSEPKLSLLHEKKCDGTFRNNTGMLETQATAKLVNARTPVLFVHCEARLSTT